MAVLVISGSGRGVGKTAVGCSLMAALPELRWVGVKVSPHEHGMEEHASVAEARLISADLVPAMDSRPTLKPFSSESLKTMIEERDRGSAKDTGRYLEAGAQRAFLVSGEADRDLACLCGVRAGDGESLLVESNRFSAGALATGRESTLQLMVLGGCVNQWKASAWERMAAADAVVLTGGFPVEQLPAELRWKRLFSMVRGEWGSVELSRFVRRRLTERVGGLFLG